MSRTHTKGTTNDEEGQLLLTPEEPLPPRTRQKIALDHILIPDEELLSSGSNRAHILGLATSIRKIGLLQLAALEPLPDDPTYFKPVYGTRRTIALRQVGFPVYEFEVYEHALSPEQHFAASQIENAARSMNWMHMVTALHDLVIRRIEVSEQQLVKEHGFNKKEIGPYLKIAQLPTVLITEIKEGRLSKGLATRIATRLPSHQQNEVASLVLEGTKLTDELVDEVWTRKTIYQEVDSLFEDMETLSSDPHSGQKMTPGGEGDTLLPIPVLIATLLAYQPQLSMLGQKRVDDLVKELRMHQEEQKGIHHV